jgi:REP element-mobilizing transposase RayT
MPTRNRVKEYAEDSYYHVYNRGNYKQRIFFDEQDYAVFLNLLKRHLGKKQEKDNLGRLYPNYRDQLELLAFCLMQNHFHLLVYQYDAQAITRLMRSVCTSYSGYINHKYVREGRLFQGPFLARRITTEDYWLHISRYIHLNPANWQHWKWSSLPYYIGNLQADWIQPSRILDAFPSKSAYQTFVSDYQAQKALLDNLKHELASE